MLLIILIWDDFVPSNAELDLHEQDSVSWMEKKEKPNHQQSRKEKNREENL